MVRLLAVLMVMLTVSASTIPAQSPQCITLQVEFTDDTEPRQVSTAEGKATAGVQLRLGDDYRDFYLDVTIRDLASGLVLVSVREDRNSDRVVDEFELMVDGGSIQAATAPPFRLSVLRIFERPRFSCVF